VNYRQYTFLKYKNSEDAILYKFSGPVYTAGGKVQLNIQYGLMIAVKMEMVTPTPAVSGENASDTKSAEPANEKSASLPPPVGKEKFIFQQIEQQKDQLKDKIVLIEITLVGEGGDIGNGMLRYFAEDTSGSAMPYCRVDFPRDALNKLGLLDNPKKGPFSVYAWVHVFLEKKAAAVCVAVGAHVTVENGKATYSW